VPIPSRVFAAGLNQLATISICGDGGTNLTAAGTSAGAALTIVAVFNDIATVTSGSGVRLPATEPGETIYVINSGANPLTVYPASGSTINGATSNELLPGAVSLYMANTTTTWYSMQGYKNLPKKRYGSLLTTTTQVVASANVAAAVAFTTIDPAYGVSIGSPASRVVVADTGVYDIQFSAQVDNTSGGDQQVWIWARVNGTDVPNSASTLRIKGNNAETVAAWNFMLSMTAGQYFELMWTADDTDTVLLAASATSVYPGIPAVILTVNEVSL
jgi:hypothetical protein